MVCFPSIKTEKPGARTGLAPGFLQYLFCFEGRALGVVVAYSEVGADLDHIGVAAVLAVMISAVGNTALDVVDSFLAAAGAAVVSVRHVLHLTFLLLAV